MSSERMKCLATDQAFAPLTIFHEMAWGHVPFDEITLSEKYEQSVLSTITTGNRMNAVVGTTGGGKTSMISFICGSLPDTHVALRVPIVGIEDVTNVSEVMQATLSEALRSFKLEKQQRDRLARSKADSISITSRPRSFGGRFGGGAIPAELHGEVGTLETQLATGVLAVERLAGLDRLLDMMSARELTPVLIFEDTEAIVGGPQAQERIDKFFRGPVKALTTEIATPAIIAVQSRVADNSEAFQEMASSMRRVDIPSLGPEPSPSLQRIAARRLEDYGLETGDVFELESIDRLAEWYSEVGNSLRNTLSVLQAAVEHAADAGSEVIKASHVIAAMESAR